MGGGFLNLHTQQDSHEFLTCLVDKLELAAQEELGDEFDSFVNDLFQVWTEDMKHLTR